MFVLILPKYESRADLSRAFKWWYSFGDQMAQTALMRRLYRWYKRHEPACETAVFLPVLISLVLMSAFEITVYRILSVFGQESRSPEIAVRLYAVLLILFSIFVPYGWILAALHAVFLLWLWFNGIMDR